MENNVIKHSEYTKTPVEKRNWWDPAGHRLSRLNIRPRKAKYIQDVNYLFK